MTDDARSRDHIGWGRAILTGTGIVLVGFGGVVWFPDLLLQSLSSVGRDARVLIAACASMIALIVIAWALRRMQAHGVI